MPYSLKNIFIASSLAVLFLTGFCHAQDINKLFKQVETLNLERQGYILGAKLSKAQLKTAEAHPEEATAEETFKFKDGSLHVVAQKDSNRILVIYEQFKNADQKKVQQVVGDLYLSFEDPTVLAHDKIVYWAWTKKGKISTQAFDTAKKDQKKLAILATVKVVSEVKIMEKKEASLTGDAYYIISSDPILKFFADKDLLAPD